MATYPIPEGASPAGSPGSSSSTTYPTARGAGPAYPYDDPRIGNSIRWGAIVAGALTGLAVAIIMGTLGAALGLSAGAASAASGNAANLDRDQVQTAAAGIGFAAGAWLLLSALAVGWSAGTVLSKMCRADRMLTRPVFAVVTWGFGLTLAVLLGASGVSGIAAGLGAGAGGVATQAASIRMEAAPSPEVRPADAAVSRNPKPMTDIEKAEARAAVEKAAKVAATAAWFALLAQLIGLGATMLAARVQDKAKGALPAAA